MKKRSFIIAIACIMLPQAVFATDTRQNEWGPWANGLRMSISLTNDTNEIKMGEPVRLLIKIANTSTNGVFVPLISVMGNSRRDLSFKITSPSHKDVSPFFREFSRNISGIHVGGANSGQTNSFEFDLGLRLNLAQAPKFDEVGTYTIVATQKGCFWTNKVEAAVISNPLEVKVVKP